MHIDVLELLGAACGGFLGAAFGALIAFVFTGVAVISGVVALIGVGDPGFLDNVAFGPFFGPHIAFAGGVGAVAYAARRGWIKDGRDIVTPLVSLNKPSVLAVGAAFGAGGLVIQKAVAAIPGFGTHTDAVALTVVISAIVARFAFGKTGLTGQLARDLPFFQRFAPDDAHAWVPYQSRPAQAATLGLFVGGLSAWSSVTLLAAYPEASGVIYLGFGVSALSLLFMAVGMSVPVTHHITLVSAVAASAFMGKIGGGSVSLVLIGAVVGLLTALVGEAFSRFWLIRGDTHIDPPASAIWPMTTVVLLIAAAIN